MARAKCVLFTLTLAFKIVVPEAPESAWTGQNETALPNASMRMALGYSYPYIYILYVQHSSSVHFTDGMYRANLTDATNTQNTAGETLHPTEWSFLRMVASETTALIF